MWRLCIERVQFGLNIVLRAWERIAREKMSRGTCEHRGDRGGGGQEYYRHQQTGRRAGGGGGGAGVYCKGGGGLKGEGGLAGDPPSSQGPPVVPAEGGPNILKPQSSWHRRRRSKILAVSLKHWKGRRGGGGAGSRGGVPPLLLRCTAALTHPGGRGMRR